METVLRRPGGNQTLDDLNRKSDLLLQGLKLGRNMQNLTATIVNLHGKLSMPLTK